MTSYIADPSMTDVPLHLDEVDGLIQNVKALTKDTRNIEHVLRRVQATIRVLKQQIQALNRDLLDMRSQQDRMGAATTLSPMDAVRYLSPEQIQVVFGVVARQQLEWMQRQTQAAAEATQRASRETSQVRAAVMDVLRDETLPADVRDRFLTLLRAAASEQPSMPQPPVQPAAGPSVSPVNLPAPERGPWSTAPTRVAVAP